MASQNSSILAELALAVQRNCHISDSLHGRDYSLCIYLLKMREYFRWEQGYGFEDSLPKEVLGQWLSERERLWSQLEDEDFQPIEINNASHDPFNAGPINAALRSRGLVYSGGLGRFGKPHFFLAELEREERHGNVTVLISGKEYARDLTAPPAMTLDGTIFVRRESLRRMVWEKLEEWQWNKQPTPMARAAAFYDFDDDFTGALDAMTGKEVRAAVLHELGEATAGEKLGADWEDMLRNLLQTRTELVARAIRDHIADCEVTLPKLIDEEAWASLHFFFANLTGMRRELFPSLRQGYENWLKTGHIEALAKTAEQGRRHWTVVAAQGMARYKAGRKDVILWEEEQICL